MVIKLDSLSIVGYKTIQKFHTSKFMSVFFRTIYVLNWGLTQNGDLAYKGALMDNKTYI
ncbi:hypothetical protein BH09BAC6_BH09BAC6_12950 [soil metagenome]